MSKKVTFGAKPQAKEPSIDIADQWVATRNIEPVVASPVVIEPEKMKRLTIDIPDSLHRSFKSKTGGKGEKMADLVRLWIENYVAEE